MSLWFVEQEKDLIRFGVNLKNEIHSSQSEFQSIKVVETLAYGKMLILDDCVMTTDRDEFIYHEMISHIPACYHKDPKTVVVIGGGDGGTVRELLRYPSIEKIILCEIDGEVIDVCKKYFPQIACGLTNPKVEVRVADGIAYIKSLKEFADIIIVDSTDPIGPGEGLFSGEFYKNVASALKPGGVMVAQSESPWGSEEVLRKIYSNMKAGFRDVRPYVAPIPTYPRGLWSWSLATNSTLCDFQKNRFESIASGLKFLTSTRAQTIFDIPPFYAKKVLTV